MQRKLLLEIIFAQNLFIQFPVTVENIKQLLVINIFTHMTTVEVLVN